MHFTNIHSLAKIPQNHLNYFKNVQLLHSTRCTAVCSNKTLCTLGPVNVNKIYCLMQCSRGESEREGNLTQDVETLKLHFGRNSLTARSLSRVCFEDANFLVART